VLPSARRLVPGMRRAESHTWLNPLPCCLHTGVDPRNPPAGLSTTQRSGRKLVGMRTTIQNNLPVVDSDRVGHASAGGEAASGRRGVVAAQAIDVVKTYGGGQVRVQALAGVTVSLEAGVFTAVMGASGSGKSTLMHCLAGLDRPTSGRCLIEGTDLSSLGDGRLSELRRDRVGFVFQAFNLVPTLTARENITLPVDLAGRRVDEAWFNTLVTQLGLQERLGHRPSEMSGGQQQRVACARALINRPALVFADEPTGNLDSNASTELLTFLRRSVAEMGQTVVMVTHDPHGASFADRVVFLSDGRVVGALESPTADSVLERMRMLGA
jgi:putative ABC transport system ATP-binding protein